MVCCQATGAFIIEHLPRDVASTARIVSLYLPLPLILAYLPVPPEIL